MSPGFGSEFHTRSGTLVKFAQALRLSVPRVQWEMCLESRGAWEALAEGECITGRLTKAGLREGWLRLSVAQQRAWGPRPALNPPPAAP